jgi:hypothetical protein
LAGIAEIASPLGTIIRTKAVTAPTAALFTAGRPPGRIVADARKVGLLTQFKVPSNDSRTACDCGPQPRLSDEMV